MQAAVLAAEGHAHILKGHVLEIGVAVVAQHPEALGFGVLGIAGHDCGVGGREVGVTVDVNPHTVRNLDDGVVVHFQHVALGDGEFGAHEVGAVVLQGHAGALDLAQGVKGVHVAGAVADEIIGHCSDSHSRHEQE